MNFSRIQRTICLIKNLKSHLSDIKIYKNEFRSYTTNLKYENRNMLKLKERGLVVGIFPEKE